MSLLSTPSTAENYFYSLSKGLRLDFVKRPYHDLAQRRYILRVNHPLSCSRRFPIDIILSKHAPIKSHKSKMLYILPFLILMSSAAANKVARKRLNEPMQHPQRRENLLPSNDYGMDWFTSVEQIDEESSSTLEEEIASTMEPSRQPVSSAPTAPPTSSAPTSTAPTAPPTLHPTSPFQGRDALPLASRMGCPASQRKVQFVIAVDKWGAETTWEIRRVRTDSVVLSNSRTYEPYDEERVEVCLESGSPEEEYELTLFDEVVRSCIVIPSDTFFAFKHPCFEFSSHVE